LYAAPSRNAGAPFDPPQTSISAPVHTAVCPSRADSGDAGSGAQLPDDTTAGSVGDLAVVWWDETVPHAASNATAAKLAAPRPHIRTKHDIETLATVSVGRNVPL